jgi:alkylated DNA repair dioxygenase AlkB
LIALPATQNDLFSPDAVVPGLRYYHNILTPSEEAALVTRFASLPFKRFEFHGYLGNRRIVSYGFRYDYAGRRLREADPLPAFLLPLRDRAAALMNVAPDAIAHGMVTEYAPGAGIGWHVDKPEFAEIVAFSFLSPCRLRLRRKVGQKWERRALEVAPRSAYLLRGAVREEWQHSIPALNALRYSVTFRSLRSEAERGKNGAGIAS